MRLIRIWSDMRRQRLAALTVPAHKRACTLHRDLEASLGIIPPAVVLGAELNRAVGLGTVEACARKCRTLFARAAGDAKASRVDGVVCSYLRRKGHTCLRIDS